MWWMYLLQDTVHWVVQWLPGTLGLFSMLSALEHSQTFFLRKEHYSISDEKIVNLILNGTDLCLIAQSTLYPPRLLCVYIYI